VVHDFGYRAVGCAMPTHKWIGLGWRWVKECEVEGLSAGTKHDFFDAFDRSSHINTPRPENRILQSKVTPPAANVSDGQHHAEGRVDRIAPMAFDGGIINGEAEELKEKFTGNIVD